MGDPINSTIEYEQQIVVMLDVLGFKEKVTSIDRFDEFNNYIKCVNSIKEELSMDKDEINMLGTGTVKNLIKGVNLRFISDTSIINIPIHADEPYQQILTVLICIGKIFLLGLEHGILFRGAISVGEVIQCKAHDSIAGTAVNECAAHYEIADWVGCHLAPSAAKFFAQSADKRPKEDQHILYDMMKTDCVPIKKDGDEPILMKLSGVNWIKCCSYLDHDVHFKKHEGIGIRVRNINISSFEKSELAILYLMLSYSSKHPVASKKINNTIIQLGYTAMSQQYLA